MPIAAHALDLTNPYVRARFERKFWSHIASTVESDECWWWKGTTSDRGYGRVRFGRFIYKAPRLAYALAIGPIPEGLVVDHLCANPGCVNPYHLELVTNEENVARHFRKQTHCLRGHEFTPENTYIHASRGTRRCRRCHREAAARRKAQDA